MKAAWMMILILGIARTQEPRQTEPAPSPAEESAPTPAPVPSFGSISEELTSLEALNSSILRREQQRDALFERMQAVADPLQREAMLPDVQRLNQEINALNRRFQTIALRTDISLFEGEPQQEFNWQDEVAQLLEPLVVRFKEATKDSREFAEMKSNLELNQQRRSVAKDSVRNLETLIAANNDPVLGERFAGLQEVWTGRLQDAENQVTFYELQLRQRAEGQASPIEQTRKATAQFVRTSGRNLLFGIFAFALVFFGMRFMQMAWRKFRPGKQKGRSFSARLTTLVWTLLSVVLAIGAMLAAFNATGDIFLTSLTLVFILGICWGGIKTLPSFLEQIRMMLNMGAVREDEVLIHDGLPWLVNNISFRTELVNPRLNGGVLTIPTPLLVGQVSRPPGDKEEWFPSRESDWVVLGDGTFGRIAYQTPTAVQVVQLGGAQQVYPTLAYLALNPTVLSTGFRREMSFDLDFSLLADITRGIPKKMEAHLGSRLRERLGESLVHLDVRLADVRDSSLRIAVMADCDGEAAAQWPLIPMWTQSALVDLCVAEQWTIPFPQLQVHTDRG